ncbi:hypothetical protein B6U83_00780 [Thermoplasmatales archaeon ex4484_36]|nr:MAG: hypothetical protein B6U83_00780 [Thermoplasmatales archaeon ex4484_36]
MFSTTLGGAGKVADDDVYKEITRKIAEVYEAEKGRPSLYPLEETFFQDVKKLLNYLWDRYIASQESVKESSRAPLYLEEYRNFKRILTQIYLRREKKIVRLAISAAMGGVVNTENMVATEKKLFESLREALDWHRRETLGGYLSGMGTTPSVDTTAEEYIEEPVVPPPRPSQAKGPEAQGEEGAMDSAAEEKLETAEEVSEPAGARAEMEAVQTSSEGGVVERTAKKDEGGGMTAVEVTREEDGRLKGVDMGITAEKHPHRRGAEPFERGPKRGELFGTKEILFVEKEIGDIATKRERSLYLRSNDVLYTDREIMEALSKGGFGRLVTTKD